MQQTSTAHPPTYTLTDADEVTITDGYDPLTAPPAALVGECLEVRATLYAPPTGAGGPTEHHAATILAVRDWVHPVGGLVSRTYYTAAGAYVVPAAMWERSTP